MCLTLVWHELLKFFVAAISAFDTNGSFSPRLLSASDLRTREKTRSIGLVFSRFDRDISRMKEFTSSINFSSGNLLVMLFAMCCVSGPGFWSLISRELAWCSCSKNVQKTRSVGILEWRTYDKTRAAVSSPLLFANSSATTPFH